MRLDNPTVQAALIAVIGVIISLCVQHGIKVRELRAGLKADRIREAQKSYSDLLLSLRNINELNNRISKINRNDSGTSRGKSSRQIVDELHDQKNSEMHIVIQACETFLMLIPMTSTTTVEDNLTTVLVRTLNNNGQDIDGKFLGEIRTAMTAYLSEQLNKI